MNKPTVYDQQNKGWSCVVCGRLFDPTVGHKCSPRAIRTYNRRLLEKEAEPPEGATYHDRLEDGFFWDVHE